jgi:hypothetical protein
VSGVVDRLHARRRARHDDYVLCPEDGFWFRPSYTDGTCPLCGAPAPGGPPPASRMRQMDRSWFGMAALALESLGMLVLVLLMYFKG